MPGITAVQAVEKALNVKSGERVLVAGGGGVTGGALVQVAAAAGAEVLATAGASSAARLRSYGAREVVDYHDQDWPETVRELSGGGVDAAVNAAPHGAALTLRAVRDGGRLVTITGEPPAVERGIAVAELVIAPEPADLARAVALAGDLLLRIGVAGRRAAFGAGRRGARAGRDRRPRGSRVDDRAVVAATCSQFNDQGICVAHQALRLRSRAPFVVVAAVFLAGMAGGSLPTPLYPLYQARWGLSNLAVTAVFAAYAAGVLVALLALGRLSDQAGRRPVLLLAVALAAASTVVFLVAQGLVYLFVGRFLSGLAIGALTGTATAALAELEPAGDKGKASLTAAVVNPAGLALGTLAAGALAQYGLARVRLVYGVYLGVLVALAVAVRWLPETVPSASGRLALRPQRLHVPAAMRGPFVVAAFGVFSAFVVLGLFSGLAPSFLGEALHGTNVFVARIARVDRLWHRGGDAAHRRAPLYRRRRPAGRDLHDRRARARAGRAVDPRPRALLRRRRRGRAGCRLAVRQHPGTGQPLRPGRAPRRSRVRLLRGRLPRPDAARGGRGHRLRAHRRAHVGRVALGRRRGPGACSPAGHQARGTRRRGAGARGRGRARGAGGIAARAPRGNASHPAA